MRLGADHSKPPLIAQAPERLRAALRGEAAAGDHDALAHRFSPLIVSDISPILSPLALGMLSAGWTFAERGAADASASALAGADPGGRTPLIRMAGSPPHLR
jgi:hypothetical protein